MFRELQHVYVELTRFSDPTGQYRVNLKPLLFSWSLSWCEDSQFSLRAVGARTQYNMFCLGSILVSFYSSTCLHPQRGPQLNIKRHGTFLLDLLPRTPGRHQHNNVKYCYRVWRSQQMAKFICSNSLVLRRIRTSTEICWILYHRKKRNFLW